VIGTAFGRCRQRDQAIFVSLGDDDFGDFEAALGERAGLVEYGCVDFGGPLQNRAAAHQDSAAR
jgi:hypothetical protein